MAGHKLQARWKALGKRVDGCRMFCGDIADRSDLLAGVDVVIAIRTIYHLREALDPVFASIAAAGVQTIVLGGNANRAKRFAQGALNDTLGPLNLYASIDGMAAILTRHGYTPRSVCASGDPIVTGSR